MNNAQFFLKKLVVIITILIPVNSFLFAQTETSDNLDESSLQSQFDYIFKKSESYEQYKIIKKSSFETLRKNTFDSIASLKQSIGNLETLNEKQKSEINNIKSELEEGSIKLNRAIDERDSFSFLGILISKGTYNSIVWLIIFALIAGFVIMFALYKRSHVTTAKIKEALNEKQEEFDAHRKWALEREQTLARELNKLKQKYKGLE